MLPAVRIVLAVTDLSPFGNAPIPHAYAVAAEGGTVHLLHVLESRLTPSPLYAHYAPGKTPTEEERRLQVEALEAKLRALVPPEADARGIATETTVRGDALVSDAIVDEADRIGADLVCMGTHGRTGIARALLGSVAAEVLRRTRRPVLVVRPDA